MFGKKFKVITTTEYNRGRPKKSKVATYKTAAAAQRHVDFLNSRFNK